MTRPTLLTLALIAALLALSGALLWFAPGQRPGGCAVDRGNFVNCRR